MPGLGNAPSKEVNWKDSEPAMRAGLRNRPRLDRDGNANAPPSPP